MIYTVTRDWYTPTKVIRGEEWYIEFSFNDEQYVASVLIIPKLTKVIEHNLVLFTKDLKKITLVGTLELTILSLVQWQNWATYKLDEYLLFHYAPNGI